jgi:hypothetical protein
MERELVRGLAIPYTCVKFRQNHLRNKVARARAMTKIKNNSNSDLDLWRSFMKRKLVRGLAIPNTCVKFRQHRSINKVAREMTRQDHAYIHTIRARTYIPPATSLLEGIIIIHRSHHRGKITANMAPLIWVKLCYVISFRRWHDQHIFTRVFHLYGDHDTVA